MRILSLLHLASLILVVSGCTSQYRTPIRPESERGPTHRKTWYKVESFSSGDWRKDVPVYIVAKDGDDLVHMESLRMLKQVLTQEGFKVVAAPDAKASAIEFSYKVEESGIRLTMLFPYAHRLQLHVKMADKTVWLGKANGPSEYKEHNRALPQLLTALRPFLGKSSSGEESVYMYEDDPQVVELLKSAN